MSNQSLTEFDLTDVSMLANELRNVNSPLFRAFAASVDAKIESMKDSSKQEKAVHVYSAAISPKFQMIAAQLFPHYEIRCTHAHLLGTDSLFSIVRRMMVDYAIDFVGDDFLLYSDCHYHLLFTKKKFHVHIDTSNLLYVQQYITNVQAANEFRLKRAKEVAKGSYPVLLDYMCSKSNESYCFGKKCGEKKKQIIFDMTTFFAPMEQVAAEVIENQATRAVVILPYSSRMESSMTGDLPDLGRSFKRDDDDHMLVYDFEELTSCLYDYSQYMRYIKQSFFRYKKHNCVVEVNIKIGNLLLIVITVSADNFQRSSTLIHRQWFEAAEPMRKISTFELISPDATPYGSNLRKKQIVFPERLYRMMYVYARSFGTTVSLDALMQYAIPRNVIIMFQGVEYKRTDGVDAETLREAAIAILAEAFEDNFRNSSMVSKVMEKIRHDAYWSHANWLTYTKAVMWQMLWDISGATAVHYVLSSLYSWFEKFFRDHPNDIKVAISKLSEYQQYDDYATKRLHSLPISMSKFVDGLADFDLAMFVCRELNIPFVVWELDTKHHGVNMQEVNEEFVVRELNQTEAVAQGIPDSDLIVVTSIDANFLRSKSKSFVFISTDVRSEIQEIVKGKRNNLVLTDMTYLTPDVREKISSVVEFSSRVRVVTKLNNSPLYHSTKHDELWLRIWTENDALEDFQRPLEVMQFETNMSLDVEVPLVTNADPVVVFQEFVDQYMPGVSLQDKMYEEVINIENDINIPAPPNSLELSFKFDEIRTSTEVYKPRFRGNLSLSKQMTRRNLIEAVSQRNFNAVVQNTPIDVQFLKEHCYDSWLKRRCVPNAKELIKIEFENNPIYLDDAKIKSWIERQDLESVEKALFYTSDDHAKIDYGYFYSLLHDISKMELSMKTSGKANFSETKASLRSPHQSIVAYTKEIIAVWSSLFREVYKRMEKFLLPSAKRFIRSSPKEIEQWFTSCLQDYVGKPLFAVENDIGQFDKAQIDFILDIELYFYEKFGLNPEASKNWKRGHEFCVAVSPATGMRCQFTVSRRSGDPTTYDGNCLIAEIADAVCIDYPTFPLADITGGDDKLIFCETQPDTAGSSVNQALLFNLQSKLYTFNVGYVCSRYVIRMPTGEVKLCYDPLLAMAKFSRARLKTEAMFVEQWVSFVDNMENYKNEAVFDQVAEGVKERFGYDKGHVIQVLRALSSLANDKELYRNMWDKQVTTIQ